MIKDKYEISVWETYPSEGKFQERKLAIIGSNTMTSQCRAFQPNLVENINGTNTFTFKMYYSYFDDIYERKLRKNPFINILTNERTIKVKWGSKWYDFVIKSITENSKDKSIVYSCKDSYINELSRTGYELEFSPELENNIGNVVSLGKAILKNTDWRVLTSKCDTLREQSEEAVYEVVLKNDLTTTGKKVIKKGEKILVFFIQIQNFIDGKRQTKTKNVQFWYVSGGKFETEENKMLVLNGKCYSAKVEWVWGKKNEVVFKQNKKVVSRIKQTASVSDDYRAKRLVSKTKMKHDKKTDNFVQVYEAIAEDGDMKVGDTIYRYTHVVYSDAIVVSNLVTNPSVFTDLSGWEKVLSWDSYPRLTSSTKTSEYKPHSYLRCKKNTQIYNSGLQDNRQFLQNGIMSGQKFIIRCKLWAGNAKSGKKEADTTITHQDNHNLNRISFDIEQAKTSGGKTTYSSCVKKSATRYNASAKSMECTLTFNKNFSQDEIRSKKLRIVLKLGGGDVGSFWIREVQLFPYYVNDKKKVIEPGSLATAATVKQYYRYYNYSRYKNKAANQIQFFYDKPTPMSSKKIKAVKYGDHEKYRMLSGKQSNRFNLLQQLAETFQCWVRFRIDHNQDGSIKVKDGKPCKWVYFKEDAGQEVSYGFVYGIDLNSISRTINSDKITTKTIVAINNNELGQNGFCSIARSDQNYHKDNFILNFDYYINKGLLDKKQVRRDLYGKTDEDIGYLYHLRQYNKDYLKWDTQLQATRDSKNRNAADRDVLKTQKAAIKEEMRTLKGEIVQFAGTQTIAGAVKKFDNEVIQASIKSKCTRYYQLDGLLEGLDKKIEDYNKIIESKKSKINSYKEELSTIKTARNALIKKFNKKYFRYIQQGTWSSEDYSDDDLYYLDAEQVAYTSSRPEIQYTIAVFQLSNLEQYKNKKFHVGDITYVEDVEFFGEKKINGMKTPIKEKVLVSEISTFFDTPYKNSIKVQNYRTQFEDLFQRIGATIQALQFAQGEYSKTK